MVMKGMIKQQTSTKMLFSHFLLYVALGSVAYHIIHLINIYKVLYQLLGIKGK